MFLHGTAGQISASVNLIQMQYFYLIYYIYSNPFHWPNDVLCSTFVSFGTGPSRSLCFSKWQPRPSTNTTLGFSLSSCNLPTSPSLPPRLMSLFLLLGLLECLTLQNTYFSCSLKLYLLWRLCLCPSSAQMELTQLCKPGDFPFNLSHVLYLKPKHTWNILVHIHEYISGPTHHPHPPAMRL